MSTALRSLQRRIVELGLDSGRVAEAMNIARGLAMTSYRTATEFAERFTEATPPSREWTADFSVDRYLRHCGERFVNTMTPERFLALSLSADLHRIDPTRVRTRTTIVAAEGDTVVPRPQLEALASRIGADAELVDLPTRVGHDAFLVETDGVSSILSKVLDRDLVQ
jgi:homoserine O-acetyltransferase